MCGIGAIINLSDSSAPVEKGDLQKMIQVLSGRGPDATGWWISEDRSVGLANTRLSTQDARPIANQPLWNLEKSVVVTLNGEIYNHPELRGELERKGCSFRTKSDTEVLANGFRVYGKEVLQKIKGQFAFAAYNVKTREVLIARDPYGICPLYYTTCGGQLILASTPGAILELGRVPRRLDHQAVYDWFVTDSVCREKTFFEDLSSLRSGFCLHFEANRSAKRSRYYRLDSDFFEPDRSRSERDWVEESRELLNAAVVKCMMGDKEVGVYLSGGIDSVSVMALVRKLFPDRKVKTFCAGFADVLTGEPIGEIDFAKEMAETFETEHHEVIVTAEDIVRELGTFDLPPSSIIDTTIRKLARTACGAGVNVALSGEGSDEIFFGYEHFMAAVAFFNPRYRSLLKEYRLRSEWAREMMGKAEEAVLEDVFLGGGANIDMDRNGKETFRFTGSVLPVRGFVEKVRKEVLTANPSAELDKQLIYIDYSQKVPENLLRRAEGPSMGQGVEMRFPLLWDDLIRHLYHVPMAQRIGDGTTKYLFRAMMEEILPEKAKARPKTPFGTPASRKKHFEGSADRVVEFKRPAFQHLFRKNYDRLSEAVLKGGYRREKIFADRRIDETLARQRKEECCGFDVFVWKLWNLAEWYERWIAGC